MTVGSHQSTPAPTHPDGWTLSSILDNPDAFEAEVLNGKDEPAVDENEEEEKPAEEGYCIECEDQPANVRCETCEDDFCDVCFQAQHRKGTRKRHTSRPLHELADNITPTPKTHGENGTAAREDDEMTDADAEADADAEVDDATPSAPPAAKETYSPASLADRAKHIPLRLTLPERKLLRLLEAALHVSEYTDRVDILSYSSTRTKRAAAQIRELCSILSGLCLAADYKTGQELFQDRDFAANEGWFARVFEIGRRHKIMNPDKMRETYGKLVYLLMDAQSPDVQQLLGFSAVGPITTVYTTLAHHGALAVLDDPRLVTATREIPSPPNPTNKERAEVQRMIKEKERAVEGLVSQYAGGSGRFNARATRAARRAEIEKEQAMTGDAESPADFTPPPEPITPDLLRQCIYSISDNSAFLRVNRDPCEIMIGYLKKYFHPTKVGEDSPSLAIRNGRGGARLSHDHSKQYSYVLQSLTLWREILGDMFRLWHLAEQDLLASSNPYRLRDTGQGLNRVQHAPKTSREMHAILGRAQRDIGSWVGSSVIHMGDHNVPNALLFIDKYSQIYRILLPISNVLAQIPAQPKVRDYAIQEFGSVDKAIREILTDFFKHGFDGSGADSYFDAGSCIDGRLTSAWNWCSLLEKKPYFPLFLLCGFVGFDGQW
ncbi:hypothetical protein RhiJN_13229 [Ceratobasidium sp. AG-Ba]|nr:hypothetical protein RhiJN_13229 [Ceratobasidium sp. AG-Ba]